MARADKWHVQKTRQARHTVSARKPAQHAGMAAKTSRRKPCHAMPCHAMPEGDVVLKPVRARRAGRPCVAALVAAAGKAALVGVVLAWACMSATVFTAPHASVPALHVFVCVNSFPHTNTSFALIAQAMPGFNEASSELLATVSYRDPKCIPTLRVV